jgi:hypothetical protein
MGEIKSTIDLIMERTKNLTMTEEEKRQLQDKELREKVTGWVVRYLDGLDSLEDLRADMRQEGQRMDAVQRILKTVIREHLDPEEDQERLSSLLVDLLCADRVALAEALEAYRSRKKTLLKECAGEMKNRLKAAGIGGNALIVNLNKDEDSLNSMAALKDEYRDQIAHLLDRTEP